MLPPGCRPNSPDTRPPRRARIDNNITRFPPAAKAGRVRWLDSPGVPRHFFFMTDDFELIVVGGGLTGLLLGVACAGAGLDIAIIDRQPPAAMLNEAFDGRVSAIAYGSRQVLSGARIVAADRRRGRADTRNPGRRRQFAAVPALRPPGAGDRRAARLHRREPRAAPRSDRSAQALSDLEFLAPLAVDMVEASPLAAVAVLSDGRRASVAPRRRGRRRGVAAAPRRRHPHRRVALPPDRHRHDRAARAPACRDCGRAFSAGGAVRDLADDRQQIVDCVDRAQGARPASDGALRHRLRGRAAAPASAISWARSSRSGRAGPTRSGCCSRSDTGRAAWPWSARRRT